MAIERLQKPLRLLQLLAVVRMRMKWLLRPWSRAQCPHPRALGKSGLAAKLASEFRLAQRALAHDLVARLAYNFEAFLIDMVIL